MARSHTSCHHDTETSRTGLLCFFCFCHRSDLRGFSPPPFFPPEYETPKTRMYVHRYVLCMYIPSGLSLDGTLESMYILAFTHSRTGRERRWGNVGDASGTIRRIATTRAITRLDWNCPPPILPTENPPSPSRCDLPKARFSLVSSAHRHRTSTVNAADVCICVNPSSLSWENKKKRKSGGVAFHLVGPPPPPTPIPSAPRTANGVFRFEPKGEEEDSPFRRRIRLRTYQ